MNPERVAVIIPAFQEEERVGATVSAVRQAYGYDVVVVDDGSKDRTAEVALRAGATVLRLPINLGYGGALQAGFRYALEGGFTRAIQMDADGQHDPQHIAPLLAALDEGPSDVAVGSRFLVETGYRMSRSRRVGRVIFSAIIRLATGQRVTDPTSGFQALGTRAIQLYASDAYPVDFPDADVLILLHKCGLSFVEVPVVMHANPKQETMHSGIVPLYYVFKMFLSILVTLMRKQPAVPPAHEVNSQ